MARETHHPLPAIVMVLVMSMDTPSKTLGGFSKNRTMTRAQMKLQSYGLNTAMPESSSHADTCGGFREAWPIGATLREFFQANWHRPRRRHETS